MDRTAGLQREDIGMLKLNYQQKVRGGTLRRGMAERIGSIRVFPKMFLFAESSVFALAGFGKGKILLRKQIGISAFL